MSLSLCSTGERSSRRRRRPLWKNWNRASLKSCRVSLRPRNLLMNISWPVSDLYTWRDGETWRGWKSRAGIVTPKICFLTIFARNQINAFPKMSNFKMEPRTLRLRPVLAQSPPACQRGRLLSKMPCSAGTCGSSRPSSPPWHRLHTAACPSSGPTHTAVCAATSGSPAGWILGNWVKEDRKKTKQGLLLH